MHVLQDVYRFPAGFNDTGTVVWDLQYASLNSSAWGGMGKLLGCRTWQPPNHVLFQLACALLAAGLLAFDTPYGALLLHSLFFLGEFSFVVDWA